MVSITTISACSNTGGQGTQENPHTRCTSHTPNCVSEICSCVGTAVNPLTGTGDGTGQGSCAGDTERCHADGTCSVCSANAGVSDGTVVAPHSGCGYTGSGNDGATNLPRCVSNKCSCVGNSRNATHGVGDGTGIGSCAAGRCHIDGTCSVCSDTAGGFGGTVVSPHSGCGIAGGTTTRPNCRQGTCSCVGNISNGLIGVGDGTAIGSCATAGMCHSDGNCTGTHNSYRYCIHHITYYLSIYLSIYLYFLSSMCRRRRKQRQWKNSRNLPQWQSLQ